MRSKDDDDEVSWFQFNGETSNTSKWDKKGGTFLKLRFLIRGFDETRDARNKINKLTK